MLSQLYIKNFAVIKELTVDFTTGFNVFTGETGAGKTMLINAISSVLGGRVTKDIVRTGEDKAVISAYFDDLPDEVEKLCNDLGYDTSGEILVQREITNSGKSTCKLNGRPATISMLKEITSNLIAIHGQQDGNAFSDENNQIAFLDKFGDCDELLNSYQECFKNYSEVRKKIKSISTDEALKAQKVDLLNYQINEITSADITIGEEEELLETRKKIRNFEKIKGYLEQSAELFNNGDSNIIEQMENAVSCLKNLSPYMKNYEEMSQKCEEMLYEIQEIYENVRNDLDDFDDEYDDINTIEERIDTIHTLERKYGATEEEVLEFLSKAQKELGEINSSEENLNLYNKRFKELELELAKIATSLTQARKKSAHEFIKRVKSELKFLDMPSVEISIEITKADYTENGCDDVVFLISPNPGEPLKPIAKIASGGETSRIMLAIKNVMADKDNIQSLIFDEIDTGVSGTAAQKIGKKLKEVSINHQVICITHLAQVASFGHTHFKIKKNVKDERTFTTLEKLDFDDRVKELARIVVGDSITDASLENAKEMLTENSN